MVPELLECRMPLVEEAAEEQDCPDREERERAGDRAQL
jgi:hypothetical protein